MLVLHDMSLHMGLRCVGKTKPMILEMLNSLVSELTATGEICHANHPKAVYKEDGL